MQEGQRGGGGDLQCVVSGVVAVTACSMVQQGETVPGQWWGGGGFITVLSASGQDTAIWEVHVSVVGTRQCPKMKCWTLLVVLSAAWR
jgi:hypothetical protein